MELAGISKAARRRLVGLSRGEIQRVMLARALVHDPELLILDEPAAGLDPNGRIELRELLRVLHDRGKTIVVSSHVLSDLECVCTHIGLIDRGRVLYSGSRETLMRRTRQKQRVTVDWLGSDSVVESLVAGVPDVSPIAFEDGRATLEISGDPMSAVRLLQRLVDGGALISSFACVRPTLEDLYLEMLSESEDVT